MPQQSLADLIQSLAANPQMENVVDELAALQSIYGDSAIAPYHHQRAAADAMVRYQVVVHLPPPHEHVGLRVLVSLPHTYPLAAPPQLQLLSRYIGAFGVSADLFGAVLRTYHSSHGVGWNGGLPAVFDGLDYVVERCAQWYHDRLLHNQVSETLRDDVSQPGYTPAARQSPVALAPVHPPVHEADEFIMSSPHLVVVDPIFDRKSSFVGRACKIASPAEVPLILASLLNDKKVARAAHPVINAWRCTTAHGVRHQDNDDDGEMAAGGRLAHLLQILDVDNVLVVVTRYFGGIHLGPDRFKHINQAARNALEAAGLLDAPSGLPHKFQGRK